MALATITDFSAFCACGFPPEKYEYPGYEDIHSQLNRRRRPGKKAGLFDEMEIFKHNADIFIGPAMYSGSGPFLDELLLGLKVNQPGFGTSEGTTDASFITGTGGFQYRICPGYKERGFINLLSYAFGCYYQRRGYSYVLEKASKVNSVEVADLLVIREKIRTNYISIPVSARLGRRLFIEAGLSFDFLLQGRSEFELERSSGPTGAAPDNGAGYLSSFGDSKRISGMKKVIPFVAPSIIASTGFYFNENTGIRFFANFSNAFFKADSNPEKLNFASSMFSVQLISCINSNKI